MVAEALWRSGDSTPSSQTYAKINAPWGFAFLFYEKIPQPDCIIPVEVSEACGKHPRHSLPQSHVDDSVVGAVGLGPLWPLRRPPYKYENHPLPDDGRGRLSRESSDRSADGSGSPLAPEAPQVDACGYWALGGGGGGRSAWLLGKIRTAAGGDVGGNMVHVGMRWRSAGPVARRVGIGAVDAAHGGRWVTRRFMKAEGWTSIWAATGYKENPRRPQ